MARLVGNEGMTLQYTHVKVDSLIPYESGHPGNKRKDPQGPRPKYVSWTKVGRWDNQLVDDQDCVRMDFFPNMSLDASMTTLFGCFQKYGLSSKSSICS